MVPAIAMLAFVVFYSRWWIPSASMMPAMEIGDSLAASRWAHVDLGASVRNVALGLGLDLFRPTPERGEVVVFKYPGPNPDYRGATYIKRVIGLPGERVQVSKGILHIDGKPVERRELEAPARAGHRVRFGRYVETLPSGRSYEILELDDQQMFDNTPVFAVPPNHYFVMDDNRDNAADSRSEGGWFVPHNNLVARVDRVLWSFEEGASWRLWEWPATFRPERFLKAVQ
jgi:signal peptidase I